MQAKGIKQIPVERWIGNYRREYPEGNASEITTREFTQDPWITDAANDDELLVRCSVGVVSILMSKGMSKCGRLAAKVTTSPSAVAAATEWSVGKSDHMQVAGALNRVCLQKLKLNKPLTATATGVSSTDSKRFRIMQEIRQALNPQRDKRYALAFGEISDSSTEIWGPSRFLITPQYGNNGVRKATEYQFVSTPADNFLNVVRHAIPAARRYVDFTSLSVPDPSVLPTFQDALDELNTTCKRLDATSGPGKCDPNLTLRFVFGTNMVTVQKVDVEALKVQLIKKITASGARLRFSLLIATYDVSSARKLDRVWLSWNHSKIVAVDDKILITGGHNLYDSYTRPVHPVHDVSISVTNPNMVQLAHDFVQEIWNTVLIKSTNSGIRAKFESFLQLAGKGAGLARVSSTPSESFLPGSKPKDELLKDYRYPGTRPADLAIDADMRRPIIGVGRFGNIASGSEVDDASDIAQLVMLNKAEREILTSQQALLPIYPFRADFNTKVIDAIMNAVNRGVSIYALTSSDKEEISGKGANGYGPGHSSMSLALPYIIRRKIEADHSGRAPTDETVDKWIMLAVNLYKNFHVLPTGNLDTEVPNHAKVLIIDRQAAYIGSHNLYDDSHAEFGVIVGPQDTAKLFTDYFMPFWNASSDLAARTSLRVGKAPPVAAAPAAGTRPATSTRPAVPVDPREAAIPNAKELPGECIVRRMREGSCNTVPNDKCGFYVTYSKVPASMLSRVFSSSKDKYEYRTCFLPMPKESGTGGPAVGGEKCTDDKALGNIEVAKGTLVAKVMTEIAVKEKGLLCSDQKTGYKCIEFSKVCVWKENPIPDDKLDYGITRL